MRPLDALNIYRTGIREIALSHRVRDVCVFNPVLRGEDNADSDRDLLVEATAQTTLIDIGAVRFELICTLRESLKVMDPGSSPG